MGVHLFSKKLENSYIRYFQNFITAILLNVRHVMSRCIKAVHGVPSRSQTSLRQPRLSLSLFMDHLSAVEDILGHVEFWPSTVIRFIH